MSLTSVIDNKESIFHKSLKLSKESTIEFQNKSPDPSLSTDQHRTTAAHKQQPLAEQRLRRSESDSPPDPSLWHSAWHETSSVTLTLVSFHLTFVPFDFRCYSDS
jgi:hypothetical protein